MKKVCPKCNLEISAQNFSRHIARCDGSGLSVYKKVPRHINSLNCNCKFCGKEYTSLNALRQHEVRCPKNPDRRDYMRLTNYIIRERKGKNKYNDETIAKQVATAKARREAGLYEPKHFYNIKSEDEYLYLAHNKEEIAKWLAYVGDTNIEIPAVFGRYKMREGYIQLSGSRQLRKNNTEMYISFEHEYIANILLNNQLESSNTVHHINKIRDDNRPSNLMVFVDRANHLRYHTSKYAWLTFDEETKLFSCELKKDI